MPILPALTLYALICLHNILKLHCKPFCAVRGILVLGKKRSSGPLRMNTLFPVLNDYTPNSEIKLNCYFGVN